MGYKSTLRAAPLFFTTCAWVLCSDGAVCLCACFVRVLVARACVNVGHAWVRRLQATRTTRSLQCTWAASQCTRCVSTPGPLQLTLCAAMSNSHARPPRAHVCVCARACAFTLVDACIKGNLKCHDACPADAVGIRTRQSVPFRSIAQQSSRAQLARINYNSAVIIALIASAGLHDWCDHRAYAPVAPGDARPRARPLLLPMVPSQAAAAVRLAAVRWAGRASQRGCGGHCGRTAMRTRPRYGTVRTARTGSTESGYYPCATVLRYSRAIPPHVPCG